jgi:hypothetical protein
MRLGVTGPVRYDVVRVLGGIRYGWQVTALTWLVTRSLSLWRTNE